MLQNGSSGYLFADDNKVFRTIKTEMDCQLLQKDLANMNMWTVIWLLTFHPDKCHYMRIGHTTVWDLGYSLNGRELAHSETEKDLGIIIDSKLDFSKHIAEKVNKANSVLGTIRRTFKTLEKDNSSLLRRCGVQKLMYPRQKSSERVNVITGIT